MKIADNISWKTLQDKVVAVDINTGIYYTLNKTASKIWHAIDEGKDFDAILTLFKETYSDQQEDEMAKDIQENIDYWREEKLIV